MTGRNQRHQMEILWLEQTRSQKQRRSIYIYEPFFSVCVSQHFICHNNAIVNLYHVLRVIHFWLLKIH